MSCSTYTHAHAHTHTGTHVHTHTHLFLHTHRHWLDFSDESRGIVATVRGHHGTRLVDLCPVFTSLLHIVINRLTLSGVNYGTHVYTLEGGGGGKREGREGGGRGERKGGEGGKVSERQRGRERGGGREGGRERERGREGGREGEGEGGHLIQRVSQPEVSHPLFDLGHHTICNILLDYQSGPCAAHLTWDMGD